jgi:hypothetical protein
METAGVYTDIYIVIARNVAVFPRNVAVFPRNVAVFPRNVAVFPRNVVVFPRNVAITIIRMKTMIKNHYTIKVEIEMILHWMV